MHRPLKASLGAVGALALALSATAVAGASPRDHHDHDGRGDRVVFVQTDNLSGNAVVAYDRAPDGTLTLAGTYPTGGLGGQLNGSAVDHLASQGSLAYDADAGVLLAVNAGSNSISAFSVAGDRLSLRQVIGSGGTFPSSIAVSGDLVYVLNATDGGSVVGFRLNGGGLHPLHDGTRALGLTTPTDTTQFTHTPGQVAFSPDGRQLLVTTKATTSAVDVFGVRPDGRLSQSAVVNVEAGAVPFATWFIGSREVAIADAGSNAVSTYALGDDGTLTALATLATGQAATCWVTGSGGYLFASNAGSASLSEVATGPGGTLSSVGLASTDKGTVDAAVTPDGAYLYVQAGGPGAVDAYRVGPGGALAQIGAVTVPGGAGGEGIVAL